MAFLFSSICPYTVALLQWSDVLWLVCKSGSPFFPCFLFISPPMRNRWRTALPFQTVACFMSSGCVMHVRVYRSTTELSTQGFYHARFLLFLIFHLTRQITYSHPVLAAVMSTHLHEMPLFSPPRQDTPIVEWWRIALSEHWIGFLSIILRLDS